jgi:hypothetical protein
MAGIGLLHRIHRQGANGVDAELIEIFGQGLASAAMVVAARLLPQALTSWCPRGCCGRKYDVLGTTAYSIQPRRVTPVACLAGQKANQVKMQR